MWESEAIAEHCLELLGWKPIQIVAGVHTPENKGLPDFECSEDRHVEVKTMEYNMCLSKPSLERIKELNENNEKTYLMVITRDYNKCDVFSIKHEFSVDDGTLLKAKYMAGSELD